MCVHDRYIIIFIYSIQYFVIKTSFALNFSGIKRLIIIYWCNTNCVKRKGIGFLVVDAQADRQAGGQKISAAAAKIAAGKQSLLPR